MCKAMLNDTFKTLMLAILKLCLKSKTKMVFSGGMNTEHELGFHQMQGTSFQ